MTSTLSTSTTYCSKGLIKRGINVNFTESRKGAIITIAASMSKLRLSYAYVFHLILKTPRLTMENSNITHISPFMYLTNKLYKNFVEGRSQSFKFYCSSFLLGSISISNCSLDQDKCDSNNIKNRMIILLISSF